MAFFGLGCFFFKDSLPREKQPLVPIFFSGLFFLLCSFPELAWLEKWIEGIDLLLLFLGIFSLMEVVVGPTDFGRERYSWRRPQLRVTDREGQ